MNPRMDVSEHPKQQLLNPSTINPQPNPSTHSIMSTHRSTPRHALSRAEALITPRQTFNAEGVISFSRPLININCADCESPLGEKRTIIVTNTAERPYRYTLVCGTECAFRNIRTMVGQTYIRCVACCNSSVVPATSSFATAELGKLTLMFVVCSDDCLTTVQEWCTNIKEERARKAEARNVGRGRGRGGSPRWTGPSDHFAFKSSTASPSSDVWNDSASSSAPRKARPNHRRKAVASPDGPCCHCGNTDCWAGQVCTKCGKTICSEACDRSHSCLLV